MLLLQNSENIQPTFYCRKEFFPGAPHHCAVSGFGSTGVNPPGIPLHRHPIRFELLLAAKVCLKCTMFGYCQRMKLGNHNTNTQSCAYRCTRASAYRLWSLSPVALLFQELPTFCATVGKCCPSARFLVTCSCLRERPHNKCRNVRPVTEMRRQPEPPVPRPSAFRSAPRHRKYVCRWRDFCKFTCLHVLFIRHSYRTL